jgi:Zn-dependent protease with chaperone function
MFADGDPILYLPVIVWAATGLGLILVGRRRGPVVLLRLSAAFFALWALLATTTLLYVIEHGGFSAITGLAAHPATLFATSAAPIWIDGAIGAGVVLFLGFTVNQLVGRAILRTLGPKPLSWPRRLPHPGTETQLGRFESDAPQAFSFTLIVRRPGRGGPIGRREVILVSEELLRLLDPAEQESVIAHELGHLTALDSRYLTYLRTCARLLRWDPVVAALASSLTREEELRADRVAVELPGRPEVLASALRKVSRNAPMVPVVFPLSLLGAGRRQRRQGTEERIRRLLERSGASASEGE